MASIRSGIGENMEDRYLFKGKRLDNGVWVQGYLFGIWEKRYILWGMTNDIPNMIEVDPSTICQCTGLKDKNSKLIWENDVVRVCWQDNEAQCEEIAQVTWDKFGYYPWLDEYRCDGCDLFNEVRDIEVIGNVFDNAGLLESEG